MNAKYPDELAALMAKDELSDQEFSRLLAYLPGNRLAAVLVHIGHMLADVAAVDALPLATRFGR